MAKLHRQKLRDLSEYRSRRRGGARHANGSLKHDIDYAYRFGITNGALCLFTRDGRQVDGRTVAARLFRHTVADLVDQLGGDSNVTAAQLMLCRRAAMLEVDIQFQEAEALDRKGNSIGKLDAHIYSPLTKVQRQILATLGVKKKRRKINAKLIEGSAHTITDVD